MTYPRGSTNQKAEPPLSGCLPKTWKVEELYKAEGLANLPGTFEEPWERS